MAIKDMVKELTGKTLDRYNRKIGLGEIGVNDPTQDKILNGIYSQVDYGYLSKTEQSSVLHLDGSGDGVVEIESVEGNSLVNCSLAFDGYTIYANADNPSMHLRKSKGKSFFNYKPNTNYTIIINIIENTIYGYNTIQPIDNYNCVYNQTLRVGKGVTGVFKKLITTVNQEGFNDPKKTDGFMALVYGNNGEEVGGKLVVEDIMILEGDWTNKEIPASYFKGLQSSFEEKVNDEGKYEIEILSNNKNVLDVKNAFTCSIGNWDSATINKNSQIGNVTILENSITVTNNNNNYHYLVIPANLKAGVEYYLNYECNTSFGNRISFYKDLGEKRIETISNSIGKFTLSNNCKYIGFPINNTISSYVLSKLYINIKNDYGFIEPKLNKIKLLVNEPLRGLPNGIKDRLCVKDGKLVVERKCESIIFTGDRRWKTYTINNSVSSFTIALDDMDASKGNLAYEMIISDKLPTVFSGWNDFTKENISAWNNNIYITYPFTKGIDTIEKFNENLRSSNIKLLYQLAEPYYEEVLNEYGEPILLEGYENGTLYIDSIIVPTTTVRYTQKNESLATIGSINQNNTKTFSDISEDLIPYMMELDFMLMEAEMKSEGLFKMRRVEDLTSMQKRTGDMLARLIKGETLTKEEAFERVVVYLEAGRITQEQATELNLLIQETYRG